MNPVTPLWLRARIRMSAWAARRSTRLAALDGNQAERWLRLAARLAPGYGSVHRDLVAARRKADDRLGAVEIARAVARRFDYSAEAWCLLGEALNGAFRPVEALVAFERALVIEERADAAMAAGDLYARKGLRHGRCPLRPRLRGGARTRRAQGQRQSAARRGRCRGGSAGAGYVGAGDRKTLDRGLVLCLSQPDKKRDRVRQDHHRRDGVGRDHVGAVLRILHGSPPRP